MLVYLQYLNCKGSAKGDGSKSCENSTLSVAVTDDLHHNVQPKDFNQNKHKILISELKHLYTAVTRARANLYIFDEDEDKRQPMFHYFASCGLVEIEERIDSASLSGQ